MKAGHLRDDVGRAAKTVNAETSRVTRLSQRPITDQARAEKRCRRDIVERVRNRKAKAGISHRELGVAAINCVTSEPREIAEILAVRPAVFALAASPAEPRNADAFADAKTIDALADPLDMPDDLVSENQRQFRIRQFAIDDVEIGPTNRASAHANK